MIRSIAKRSDGVLVSKIPANEYKKVLQDTESLLWVDICGETKETSQTILREIFNFHPLAIADALDQVHVPKVDDWGDYLYIVARAIAVDEKMEKPIETEEIDIFLGKNYLVTYCNKPIMATERIWEREQKSQRIMKAGVGQLLYTLIDEIADDFINLSEYIDEEIDAIEDQLFNQPEPDVLERIFSLKRSLLHLRRIISPQREIVNKLSRGDYDLIGEEARIYFRDVYDHFLRLFDILENLRELTGNALEVYLSVVNNRMNNVMKTLTIITTLFMPISFLAGFFGMNFFQPVETLPNWTGRIVFQLTIIVIVLFPIGMYIWIKRRGWIQ
jgi:magnesium transporter